MKSLFVLLLGVCLAASCRCSLAEADLVGAGSTLSNSLMDRVAPAWQARSGTRVSYQPLGSGEGIRRLAAGAVDFALSDVPLSRYELELLDAVQMPVFFSGIVPVINLPGLGGHPPALDLTVLARIYLGQVRSWRDPALQALNPGVLLPDLPIVPVHRSDSSGSTYVFTAHLAHAVVAWNDSLGIGSKLVWPVGPGAAGTNAVLAMVATTPGAVGYVEFGEAERSGATVAGLRTDDGAVRIPGPDTLAQAAAGVAFPGTGTRAEFADAAAGTGWPLMAVTYAIVRRHAADPDDVRSAFAFVDWLIAEPGPVFTDLRFVPLRDPALLARVRRQFDAQRPAPARPR